MAKALTPPDRVTDAKQFRRALGQFATGVTVVTARSTEGRDVGLTANSFNAVSLDPPLVLWSVDKKSSTAADFLEADSFAVHILSLDDEHVSNQFTKSGIDRFAGMPVSRGIGGVPLLDCGVARFECQTEHRYDGGDHVVVVGRVVTYRTVEGPPLVFHNGGYCSLTTRAAPRTQAATIHKFAKVRDIHTGQQ